MIKVLRFANEKYPWFLAITMGFIAITFIVGMGWWGFGEQAAPSSRRVGDLSISSEEFKRAYENTYRFYKEKVPGEFKDETIKQYVVEQSWITGCGSSPPTTWVCRCPMKICDPSIMQIPEFQRNGRFDPEHYRRLLAANHLTPSMFEGVQAKELLSLKARMVVSERRRPDAVRSSRKPKP